MTSGPVVDIAKAVKDTKLGMMKPVLVDTAVPRDIVSGWLEIEFLGAVDNGAFDKVDEYTISGGLLDLGILASVDTEA